jgi:hypothetical protein
MAIQLLTRSLHHGIANAIDENHGTSHESRARTRTGTESAAARLFDTLGCGEGNKQTLLAFSTCLIIDRATPGSTAHDACYQYLPHTFSLSVDLTRLPRVRSSAQP